MPTLTIDSSRFGTLEIASEDVIEFPNGLIGLGGTSLRARRDADRRAPFRWLHSIDDPSLALPVDQPVALLRRLRGRAVRRGQRTRVTADPADVAVWVTVRAGAELADFNANLRAPILVAEGRGHQVINEAADAPVRARCSRAVAAGRLAPTAPRLRIGIQGGTACCIITRRAGEKIMVGDDIVVHVMEIVGNTVRVGIEAPRSVPVYREEIWHAVRDENRAAADAAPLELPAACPDRLSPRRAAGARVSVVPPTKRPRPARDACSPSRHRVRPRSRRRSTSRRQAAQAPPGSEVPAARRRRGRRRGRRPAQARQGRRPAAGRAATSPRLRRPRRPRRCPTTTRPARSPTPPRRSRPAGLRVRSDRRGRRGGRRRGRGREHRRPRSPTTRALGRPAGRPRPSARWPRPARARPRARSRPSRARARREPRAPGMPERAPDRRRDREAANPRAGEQAEPVRPADEPPAEAEGAPARRPARARRSAPEAEPEAEAEEPERRGEAARRRRADGGRVGCDLSALDHASRHGPPKCAPTRRGRRSTARLADLGRASRRPTRRGPRRARPCGNRRRLQPARARRAGARTRRSRSIRAPPPNATRRACATPRPRSRSAAKRSRIAAGAEVDLAGASRSRPPVSRAASSSAGALSIRRPSSRIASRSRRMYGAGVRPARPRPRSPARRDGWRTGGSRRKTRGSSRHPALGRGVERVERQARRVAGLDPAPQADDHEGVPQPASPNSTCRRRSCGSTAHDHGQ